MEAAAMLSGDMTLTQRIKCNEQRIDTTTRKTQARFVQNASRNGKSRRTRSRCAAQ
jgi:hypothetical protein